MSDYRKTKLYDSHQSLKAKLVPFSGFWMPLQYSSIIKEHHHVRSKCGLFDVSHMGQILISGSSSERFLQMVTTNNVSKLKKGQAQYSAICNEEGGIIDDIIVYNRESDYMLVVNASHWFDVYKLEIFSIVVFDLSNSSFNSFKRNLEACVSTNMAARKNFTIIF